MILDFISKDVRAYMEQNGLEFTDFEQAVIIANSGLPVLEITERLEALAMETADKDLKEQLLACIDVERQDMKAFYENRAGFVYVVQVYEDLGPKPIVCGYFSDVEAAHAHGMRQGCRFAIGKYRIMDADSVLEKRTTILLNPDRIKDDVDVAGLTIERDYNGLSVARAEYGEDGVMTYFYSYEIERPIAEGLEKLYAAPFENAFIHVPNPFECGDIVRDGEAHGIVETSQADWQDRLERVNAIKSKGKGVDFTWTCIMVDFLQDDGHIEHGLICPVFLEKYEPGKEDEDCALLLAGRSLRRGQGDLEWFTDCYDDYKKRRQQAHKSKQFGKREE